MDRHLFLWASKLWILNIDFCIFIYRTYSKFYFAYLVQFYLSYRFQLYFAYNFFAELTIFRRVDHLPPSWPFAELNPYKRRFWFLKNLSNWKRFLPPLGYELGCLGSVRRWLIHYAMKPQLFISLMYWWYLEIINYKI